MAGGLSVCVGGGTEFASKIFISPMEILKMKIIFAWIKKKRRSACLKL